MPQTSDDQKIQIEILKNNYDQLTGIIGKLDITIDKLSDVSNGINRMLAVHDERLAKQEALVKDIYELIEERRKEFYESMATLREDLKKDTEASHSKILKQMETLSTSIDSIEKWRYLVIGGAIAVGIFVSAYSSAFVKLFVTMGK